MHGRHEASLAILPSSFLWRKIHQSTMQHLETCCDLLSTYFANNSVLIVGLLHLINCVKDVCGRTSDCGHSVGAFSEIVAANGEAIMAFFDN